MSLDHFDEKIYSTIIINYFCVLIYTLCIENYLLFFFDK